MALLDSAVRVLEPFSFRGKARLLHSLCPKAGERQRRIFNCQVDLDLRDYIQRSIYLGVFEPWESTAIRAYLKPGMTFVDVGANVGYYTLMGASSVGSGGQVIAFEPSPYAFGRLHETIERNRISQVQLVSAGLGEESGELRLFMPNQKGNHTPTMVPNGGGYPVRVPVLRLDDYLTESRIEVVDLMKIDVEGFEPNVIRGATRYLERGKIRAILCEFNEAWLEANNSSVQSLFRLIVSYGFKPLPNFPHLTAKFQNVMFTMS